VPIANARCSFRRITNASEGDIILGAAELRHSFVSIIGCNGPTQPRRSGSKENQLGRHRVQRR